MNTQVKVKVKRYPVAEIFGPTIQGEGVDQGVPCHFIRFGGCDFRCEWCDTPHAVLPQAVKHNDRLTEDEIIERLSSLTRGPSWVVISGGNPALHDLAGVVTRLKHEGFKVAVETQGTKWKPWLTQVNRLCISPKPPSSGMKYTKQDLGDFLTKTFDHMGGSRFYQVDGPVFVKVVVFDDADFNFAKEMYLHINELSGGIGLPFFLSAGNDAGATVGNPSRKDDRTTNQVRSDLADKTRWLVNRVMVDPVLDDVRVQSQFHVFLWGNELGR